MAKFYTVQGTSNQMIHLFVQSAGATNGVGVTGLSFSASGLSMAYIRAGQAAHTTITLTGSGLNPGTFVSGAWIEVSAGTMPGVYEFHVPNAALTSSGGMPRVVFMAQGNASMAPVPFEIQMDAANGIFTPILAATTHAGVTIANVQTCATVTRALLVDTVSTVARALLVDTASRVLLADTVSTAARVLLVDTATTILSIAASGITNASFALNAIDTSAFSQTAADRVFSVNGAALAELGQAQPPGTPRPDQALMALYMPLRNGITVDATFMNIQNSAGTVIFKKSVSDDAVTYTELKAVAGP